MAKLSSSPEHPQPLREIVRAVKDWVERLGEVWVEGQILEINRRSGRLVFLTLRDPLAEVSVSMSADTTVLDRAGPVTEGTTVTCLVRPLVWTKSGRLNFACTDIRPSGEGRLLAAIEQRKRLLQAEGLFDPRLKKRLPLLPRRIGLITAAGSAAERDVHSTVLARWPGAAIETAHATVQGPHAVTEVIAALHALDRHPEVDVIIIARGGGSLEDLLPFSDETLVRAVHAARTPVISAIGHETDTPILDLVADQRASTPTDAAKRVVPDVVEELQHLARDRQRLRRAIDTLLRRESDHLAQVRSRPALTNPLHSFDLRHRAITDLRHRIDRAIDHRLRQDATDVRHELARVRSLSPRATLARGYAIVADAAGDEVTSVGTVAVDDTLRVLLADGELGVRVATLHHADRTTPDPDSPEQERP